MAKAKQVDSAETEEGRDWSELLSKPAAKGNNIRNWRLYRKIKTQTDLAKLTIEHDPLGKGIQRGTLCRLETGEVRYNQDQIDILSRTLRVKPRDLIGTNPFNASDIFVVYAGLSPSEKRRARKLIAALER